MFLVKGDFFFFLFPLFNTAYDVLYSRSILTVFLPIGEFIETRELSSFLLWGRWHHSPLVHTVPVSEILPALPAWETATNQQ
jgi:hypothetical protein